MKIRDSGMPDRKTWEGFFNPEHVLLRLEFRCDSDNVVDFGCGYGTFTIAAARLTSGIVHALDIDPRMVAVTAETAAREGLSNVRAVERDFVRSGTGLASGSVSYAMLFNVLHAEDATGLLREAFRVLCPDGLLAIVHWIYDHNTPRGPDLGIRPRPEQCTAWAREVGFISQTESIPLPPYHYGVLARKPMNP
jgi:SAM-dependent methyltransferase